MAIIDSILFVDDDNIANFYHVSVAKKLDIAREIFVKTNGLEALEFIKERYLTNQSLPSIILLDLHMPVLGGTEFVRELNSSELLGVRNIPVAILTSFSSPEELLSITSNGCSCVTKPLTMNKLTDVIRTSLSSGFQIAV